DLGLAVALGFDAERSRVAAIRVVRAADKRAESAELQRELAGLAGRAAAHVTSGAVVRKEMPAQFLVERLDDVADLEVLGAVDRAGEVAPEIAQPFLPVDPPAGNVVELVLQIGGEIVLDIALEKGGEERCHQPTTVLRDEAPLVEPD